MPRTHRRKYVSVHVPAELIEAIDVVIKSGKYGYRSRSEFVIDAVRRRLEKLEKQ